MIFSMSNTDVRDSITDWDKESIIAVIAQVADELKVQVEDNDAKMIAIQIQEEVEDDMPIDWQYIACHAYLVVYAIGDLNKKNKIAYERGDMF